MIKAKNKKLITQWWRWFLLWLFLLLPIQHAYAIPLQEVTALPNQGCAGSRLDPTPKDLKCDAGEFAVSATFSANDDTAPFCVSGYDFNFKIILELSGHNAPRYDLGFFVGQDGNDSRLNGGQCSVATVPTSNLPVYTDDDLFFDGDSAGDTCGGIQPPPSQTYVNKVIVNQVKVDCNGDGTGNLVVPYTLTYWPVANNLACTGPANVKAPSTSKCNYLMCDTLFDESVEIKWLTA